MATLKLDQVNLHGKTSVPVTGVVIGDVDWEAMTFTPAVTGTLNKLYIPIKKTGSPTSLIVSIKATDGSFKPTGADLATETISASVITDTDNLSIQNLAVTFSSPPSLTSGTLYAIVLHQSGGGTSTNLYKWFGENAFNNVYSSGKGWYSTNSGSTWNDASRDFAFATEMSVAPATPNFDQINFGTINSVTDDRVSTAGEWRSQTFTPSVSAQISKVELGINRVDAQTGGSITVEIQGVDGGNKPDGNNLTSIETVLDTAIPSGQSNPKLTITFSTPASLTSGTMYSIVIKFPNAGATTRYEVWNSGNFDEYSGGVAYKSTNSGSTWNTLTSISDIRFATIMTEPVTTTQTILSDSDISATETKTILSDADISATETQTILSDAVIKITTTQTILSDADVSGTSTKTILSDARVTAPGTQLLFSDADISATETQIILSDTDIAATQTKVILSDADISATETKVILSDATIIVTQTQVITSDADIEVTQSKFIFSNSAIAITTMQETTADAVIVINEPDIRLFVVV